MNQAPTYILIAALTIDGKIARHARHFTDWTSPEDKDYLHHQLDKCDVVIVGHNTYKIAAEPLLKRNCIVFTRSVETAKKKNEKCLYCNPENYNLETFLKEKKYERICILGGTETYGFFLNRSLIDEMHITIEPLIFGGGLNLFNSIRKQDIRFKLINIKKLNDNGTILLHYRKIKH